jgi:hypothetical protein
VTEKIDREIDRFFSDELLPLAARLKGESVRFLETRLEQGAASYFVRRPQSAMARIDFESGGCTSPDGVEADLAGLWSRGDGKPLAVMAPGIAQLARTLRQVEVESGDVSNFVYVMY